MTTKNYMACPTDIVEAPVGVVWKLLTDISGWGSFFDLRVISVKPPGPAVRGQRMLALFGRKVPRWLHLGGSFEYTLIDETHYKLEMDVRLPFDLTVHEAMDCVPLEDGRCRVNYHCNIGFPDGWRGRLMRILFSRGLKTSPADSLSRLKRAAEQEHRGGKAEKRTE